MSRLLLLILVILICFFALIAVQAASADEGMWLLDDIGSLDLDKMWSAGLAVSPQGIYSDKPDCLAKAVVMLGGATGSFVSKNGMIITNHHVAFAALQRHATVKSDTITEGFWAKEFAGEVPAKGYLAKVLIGYEEVTDLILSGVTLEMTDLARFKQIDKNTKELIEKEEKGKDIRCQVHSTFGGLKYYIYRYFMIKDIRVVYAPPDAIGRFGGDIDNWMWPRHTGDFAFLRAYVSPDGKSAEYSKQNVPYKPESWLKISTNNVAIGDGAMVMGYPYRTRRYLSSPAVSQHMNFDIPWQINTLIALENLLLKEGQKSEEARVALARKLVGISNYLKKLQGVKLGLEKSGLVFEKQKLEKEILFALKGKYKNEFAAALASLGKLYKEKENFAQKDAIIDWLLYSCNMIRFAATVNKWSEQKELDDLDREEEYMDRNIPLLKMTLKNTQKELLIDTDKAVLKIFLKKALALPEGRRLLALDKALNIKAGQKVPDQKLNEFIDQLYAKSKLHILKDRMAMFDLNRDDLLAGKDSLIAFAVELEKEIKEMISRQKAFDGATSRLRPKYLAGILKGQNGVVYPDANHTMRFSFGQVTNLSPRDAVNYNYMTLLRGVVEKHTGKDPFNVPPELLAAYYKQDFGKYFDEGQGGLPVNFLTTNDGTGGNSGSPVLNGKGELIGLLFDTNYEAVASDYVFMPKLSRTIVVDIRYALFIMDKVYHIRNVIDEMTVE